VRYGVRVPPGVIAQLLEALDAAYLLDNASSVQARDRTLAEYREAPFRPPTGAGQSYPDDADDLRRLLDGYLAGLPAAETSSVGVRGLVSPHIDYARGGSVYAQVWQRAMDAAMAADLALILGTDHFDEDRRLTLTRQHYATPFGVLPTSREAVDALAEVLGEEAAFAGELHHRSEHSIELAAVWLHHARGGVPCDVVPILCGSFRHFAQGETDAAPDSDITALVETFKSVAAGRQVLIVAAGDLAHVGPAFGGRPLDFVGRARLKAADDELIAGICAGDAAGLLNDVRRVDDRNNVCGVPPIYLALRMLHPTRGELVAYDRCPADRQGTSLVSVCGIVLE
jgi:AmmeMemoRadiSam system protein B